MGRIVVDIQGSFDVNEHKTFSAMETGHADCIAQVIEWLVSKRLPEAIRQDHRLHEEGAKPNKGFAIRE